MVDWHGRTATRGVVYAAVVLALVLRLVFALLYWVDKPLTRDEREYLSLAVSLSEGRGFVYSPAGVSVSEQAGRAPFYPLFLAGLMKMDPSATEGSAALVSVRIAQSILGAAGVWLIAMIGRRTAGPGAGAMAAILAAVYPPLVWISAYVLSESLYLVLALASVLTFDLAFGGGVGDAGEPRSIRRVGLALASGLLTGAAALTRPAMLLFLVLAMVWLSLKRHIAGALVLALGAALVIAPWTLRNLHEHGRFVLIAAEGGVTFWTGNHPLSSGEGDLATNPGLKRANLELRSQFPGLTAEEMEPVYYRDAFAYIKQDPVWWVGLLARKFFYIWVPVGPSYTLHSRRFFVASVVSYGLLTLFAIAGLGRRRRDSSPPYGLWLLAASSVLTCLIFFPQERFRLVLDPTLIVCAAGLAGRKALAA